MPSDTAPASAMDARSAASQRCSHTGELYCEGVSYALRTSDGARWWLELDRIPMHLIDRFVKVEGLRFGTDLISVEAIGPA